METGEKVDRVSHVTEVGSGWMWESCDRNRWESQRAPGGWKENGKDGKEMHWHGQKH